MPRPRGTPKTGGRQSGTPNKITSFREMRQVMVDNDFNPAQMLSDIALKAYAEKNYDLAQKACTAVLPYTFSRMAQITLAGGEEAPVVHISMLGVSRGQETAQQLAGPPVDSVDACGRRLEVVQPDTGAVLPVEHGSGPPAWADGVEHRSPVAVTRPQTSYKEA